MLLLECGKKHLVNYNDSCCLKHLIEMNSHAESQTLSHKYGKLLLKTLNHFYKLNQFSFIDLKLDLAKIFLDIMSKYISHFYFLNKFEFSKLLVKIALKASEETLFKEHPDIIIRRCAIYNNLACVYERTGSYAKALKYVKFYLKYSSGNLDRAVVLNNIARINNKMKDKNGALTAMKSCFEIFREESKGVMSEVFKNSQNRDSKSDSFGNTNYNNRVQLISFLYFNYGIFLQSVQKEGEAVDIFRRGYEFSISTIGEFNLLTSKFAVKIQTTCTSKLLSLESKLSLDSRYESDLDYMSILDNNNTLARSSVKKSNRTASEGRKVNKRIDPYTASKFIDKKNSISSVYNMNNSANFQLNEMNELKLKMDIILQKFDKIDIDKIDKVIQMSTDMSRTPPFKIQQSPSSDKTFSNLTKSSSLITNDKFKKIFEPGLKRLITQETGKFRNIAMRDSINNITQDLLDEIVNEFENEKSSRRDDSINGRSKSPVNNIQMKVISDKRRSINSKMNLTADYGNENNHSDVMNKSANNEKPKKSIKELFRKVIPNEKLEAIDAKNKEDNNAKEGLFSQMINSFFDDKPVKTNPTLKCEEKNKTDKPIENKRPSNTKNHTSIFNDIMNNDEDFSPTTSTSRLHNNSKHNLIESDSAKKDPTPVINILMDDTEDNYEFKPLVFTKKDSNGKEHLRAIARQFKINILLDKESNDDYEFKNLVFKRPEEHVKTTNGMNFPPINVKLDSTEDKYEAETFYIKTISESEKDKKINYAREETATFDVQSNNQKNGNTANLNAAINSNNNSLINNLNDIDTISNKPGVIITLEEGNDSYEAVTYFIKDDRSKSIMSPTEVNNKSESMDMLGHFSKEMIEQEVDFKQIAKENNPLLNKKKKDIDIKKHFENLIINHREQMKSPVFSIIRELNNEQYKIAISYGRGKDNVKGIYLRLYKNGMSKSVVAENFISFDKLKCFSTKIAIYNSLPENVDIHLINTLDIFIEKIFIYHCYIFHKDNVVALGVLTRPLGICFNRAYEFTFLKTSCIIDIFILQTKEVKFFIYNKTNDFISLNFNWVLDNTCFNSLFNEFDSKSFVQFDEEKVIKSYKTIDEKHLSKNGFITEMIITIKKIFKHKYKDESLKFDNAVVKSSNTVYTTRIRDSFRYIDLWSISYDGSANFEMDYYTLKKVQSKNNLIIQHVVKNEQIYLNLNYVINFNEFSRIIGCDYRDIASLLTERDKMHVNYILLNSFVLEGEVSESLKRKEVDSEVKIKADLPQTLFSFSFVSSKTIIFIYSFLDQEESDKGFHPVMISLEYLYNNPYNHFYKLSFSDFRSQKTYSKILSSLYFASFFEEGAVSIMDNIVSKLPINKVKINNNKFKNSLKSALLNYYYTWRRDESFFLFDSTDNLMKVFSR